MPLPFRILLISLVLIALVAPRVIAALRHRRRVAAFRKAPTRDVSAIAGDDPGAAHFKSETVQIGGPLKPGHRRLSLRDERLLPKPPPSREALRVWPRPPKPRYLTESEADRLFSASLRTGNRAVMDLATDEEQLKRYGLPAWRSEADVAAALGLSLGQYRYFSQHRHRDRVTHYVAFAIAKRSGGERIIHAPKRRLKAILRSLDRQLVAHLPVSEQAHGFVKGRSIASNARPHVGREMVARFDIKDCFPSIHFGRVRGLLIALGYSYPVAASLAVLMTEAARQPVEVNGTLYQVPTGPRVCVQGAPTSPGLCNAILLRLDRRLAKLASKRRLAYTRYADDLTFSGPATEVERLLGVVPKIVAEEGFAINHAKTRLMRQSGRQAVTGVTVNHEFGMSRKQRRRLRAELHAQSRAPDAARRPRLIGKLAFLHMLNPAQARRLTRRERNAQPGGSSGV